MTRFPNTRISSPPDTSRGDLRLMAEAVPHTAWTTDSDGSTDYVNRQGCAQLGVAAEATHEWDWLSLVHEEEAGIARFRWLDAAEAGSLFELECRLRSAGGDYRWHLVRGRPLQDGDGDVVRWIVTATDIHDQRRLEALFSGAPVGLGFVDSELCWVRVNEALAAINGAPAHAHIGRPAAELLPTVWPQVGPLWRRVLETGQPVLNQQVVGEAVAATGGRKTELTSWYPSYADGELVGVGVVAVEVPEQRRRTDEVRSVVMANIADGLYLSDRAGRFSMVNPAAERMLGWTEEDLVGKPVQATINFQQPDGTPLVEASSDLRRARSTDRPIHVAHDTFTRRDGTAFPVAYSATPLVDGEDETGLVVVFRDTSDERAAHDLLTLELDALTWVGRTRDALTEGRLVLYSQPIVPLAGGRPSEELLLRMIGREGAVIRPSIFLPAAEKYGLIGEIDRLVVARAAELAGSGRRVQANLSGLSIADPGMLPLIESSVQRAGADPADLIFEITETALIEDGPASEAFASGLAEIGCGLALDDFGTGYGSFTHLKKLPIGYLKIDMEFVRDLGSSSDNRHVIDAIIGLAKGFDQQTIAEGVEDAETLALLADCGVDFAQGYHLGRPAAPGE